MSDSFWIFCYLVIVAIVNALCWHRFNDRWKRRERARIVVGVLAVMVPGLGLGLIGAVHWESVLVLLAGFFVAGLVTLYLDIESESTEARAFREVFSNGKG